MKHLATVYEGLTRVLKLLFDLGFVFCAEKGTSGGEEKVCNDTNPTLSSEKLMHFDLRVCLCDQDGKR